MLVIPAIDLKDGCCVRLKQGRMEDAIVYSKAPVEVAKKWADIPCKRLHLVDLDGAFAGKPVNHSSIEAICKALPNVFIQIGGGIRDYPTIEQYLSMGVDAVILGTKALESQDFVKEACQLFPDKIIVGIDAKDGKVAVRGWADISQVDAITMAKQLKDFGVQAIIYTDIARDGMMQGCNVSSTVELAQASDIPVIASGGVHTLDDIAALMHANANLMGVITGKAIYEGTLDLSEAHALIEKYQSATRA